MGKLIVIEGTDCSGKETQSKLLKEKLISLGYKVDEMQFPRYDTPTGKIVGGPYLGKDYICDSYFEEGASHVPAMVASLYYAADRLYNVQSITDALNKNDVVILDRYVESNMAHQGGKILDDKDRLNMIKFLETLEYGMLKLPKPDSVIFLHMPVDAAEILKKGRNEKADGHEQDRNHLIHAEKTYLELAKMYDFKTIECALDLKIKSIDEIHEEVLKKCLEVINGK